MVVEGGVLGLLRAGDGRRFRKRWGCSFLSFSCRNVIPGATKMPALRIKGLRWWIIGLLMLGSVINYLTRSALAVAAPTLMKELGITEQKYSWIVGIFQGAIMFQPICGYVLDVVGLKAGFALFAIAWSLISMAHALAHSWQGFAGLRGLLGFAEGCANPAGMKATAEWFPAKERGLAGGLFNIGASAGSMLAPPLVAWAILAYNWQSAFVITGIIGLVWVALWLACYNAPEKHPALAEEERQFIATGQEKHLEGDGARPSILKIASQRNFWGIALPRFLADPTWGTLTFWVPLYLSTVRDFDLKQIALFAWMPFLAADLGCMCGGTIVLFLQRRGVGLINARRCAFTLGACLMTGMAFAGFVKNPYTAVALLSLGGFAHQTLSVTVITMSSDLFKRSEVATVTGLAGTCGNAGLLIFNLAIGSLVTAIGYEPFFVGLAALDLLGAAVLWTMVREKHVSHAAQTPAAAPA
jgi:ACS family hexuronate transporter-like MFS transporter